MFGVGVGRSTGRRRLMRINLFRIATATATAGFLALFPGYLLYHYAIAQDWIPAFLGGLFGSVSLLMAAVCLVLLPWLAARPLRAAFIPAVFIGLAIAYIATWTAVNFIFIRAEPYGADALKETASSILIWLAMLFVGGFFSFDKPLTRWLLSGMAVLITLSLVHAIFRFQSPLGPYLTFLGTDPDAVQSGYQGIGRSVLVTAIFLAAVVGKTHYRLAIFALGSLLLLLVGSRSDLFTLIALTAVLVFQSAFNGTNRWSTLGAMVGCAILLYVASPLFFESRSSEILDLSGSSSWQSRQDLQTSALRVIQDSPVFGAFGYHLRDGGAGWYAHNALSAWTNFGVVGFLFYVGLIIYFTLLSMRRVFARAAAGPVWFAAFYVSLAALIQAIVTSPVFSPLPALAWGVALNALRTRGAESSYYGSEAHPGAAGGAPRNAGSSLGVTASPTIAR